MITVEGRKPGSKKPLFDPFSFDPFDDGQQGERFLVRDLLSKLTREAVRGFMQRQKDQALAVMTRESLVKDLAAGRSGRPSEEVQTVEIEEAVASSLQAFEDGLFLLFVDDEEKRRLDDEVALNPSTKVTLIRMTALAGG